MKAQTASSSRIGGSSMAADQLLDAPVDAVAALVEDERPVGGDARSDPDQVRVDGPGFVRVATPADSS